MKTAAILKSALAAALLTVAVAPAAVAQDDTRFDPAATTFTGWVRMSRGEFQLYERERQLSEPFARPCVSGALPRSLQTAADLTGNKVRFTGRAVNWDDAKRNSVVRYEGSRIVNECGGEFVIQATDLTVLR